MTEEEQYEIEALEQEERAKEYIKEKNAEEIFAKFCLRVCKDKSLGYWLIGDILKRNKEEKSGNYRYDLGGFSDVENVLKLLLIEPVGHDLRIVLFPEWTAEKNYRRRDNNIRKGIIGHICMLRRQTQEE